MFDAQYIFVMPSNMNIDRAMPGHLTIWLYK